MSEKNIDKKSVLVVSLGYLMWGVQPLYWTLTNHMDPLFLLAFRVVSGALFTVGLLAVGKRLPLLISLLRDKRKMKFLMPATLFLLADWGIFIYAAQAGQLLDISLGYYLAPFVVFAIGMLIFGERPGALIYVAMGLALAGVAFSALSYGRLPIVSLLLSSMFAIYGALKKFAVVDPVVSIAAETIMLSPAAIAFILLFRGGQDGLAAVSFTDALLLAGSGIVTALPMMLYSLGVLKLPFVMLGFMQYVSPALTLACGLMLGESITPDKLIMFLFIFAALVLYLVSLVRAQKARAAEGVEKVPAE